LSNKIIPWEKKLLSLKNNVYTSDRPNLVWSKYTIKHHIFTWLTLLIILSIFGVYLTSTSYKVLQNYQNSSSQIIEKLQYLWKYQDIDSEITLREFKQIILKNLSPLTKITFSENLIERDIDKINQNLVNWLEIIEPLHKYSFNVNGFTSPVSQDSFTKDLEVFLQKLGVVLNELESLYKQFFGYRAFLSFFGDKSVKRNLASFRELLNLGKLIEKNQKTILDFLGHKTTKQIVIFNQNTGEARATGGFYGSYLPIKMSQGRIDIGQSQSIYYIDGSINPPNLPHPAYEYYNYGKNEPLFIGARDLNFTPCFQVTGKLIEQEFSRSKNGYTIDTLVMLTPNLIYNLLPNNFILNVPEIGVINKSNFLEIVERITGVGEVIYSQNPKQQISAIFKELINNLNNIIYTNGLANFLNTIIDSIQSRDIQLYNKNEDVKNLLNEAGLGSNQTCQNENKSNFITPILTNFSGDKRNLISSNNFAIESKKVFGGVKFTLKYQEYIPPKIFLQRGYKGTVGQSMIGLQIPVNSTNFSISGNDIISRSLDKPFSDIRFIEGADNSIGYKRLPEIETIRNSARNIPGGFVYSQVDGGLVLGSFIQSREGYNEVEFNFTIPIGRYQPVIFYGQPGLNNTTISLGNKTRAVQNKDGKYILDPGIIGKGFVIYNY
jgi:hypothetical protein